METYQQMQQRHRDEFSTLNIKFAFNDRQFRKALDELDVAEEEASDRLYSIGGGGFILKEDSPKLYEMLTRQHKEESEAMKDPDFAYKAFLYEIGNHEYHINLQADWDVFNCFGNVEYGEDKEAEDYMVELGFDSEIKQAFYRARNEHYRLCEENGWW